MNSTLSSTRNRLFLALLGIVVIFYFGDKGYRKFYEEPAETAERLKDQLSKKLRSAKTELKKSTQLIEHLEQLEQQSLPWDAEMARSRYLAWLLQLAEDAKLEGRAVDPGEPVSVTKSDRGSRESIELYKRFSFTVRGRGDLGQVTKFLYDFYRGGHLHKIRSMSLNPIGQGQQVDMNVSIEALALPNADREAELTSLVSEELALEDFRDYQLIARRNFFSRGATRTAWKEISLSAVTSDVRGVWEAWFRVGDPSDTIVLQVGQALTRPSFEVLVVSLEQSSALVSIDGQLYRLSIGQTLADAAPVTDG